MTSAVNFPYYTVIAAQRRGEYLFSIKGGTNKRYAFKYQYEVIKGDPDRVYLNNYYLFPYKHGTKQKVTQGYNGDYSHQGKYAIDFDLDEGTEVTAIGNGVVVELREDSNLGGPYDEYLDDANYITIYQKDGTFAHYAHLKYNGALVEIGDKIEAGDIIAYSGNTGWSQGPHLHLEILEPVYMGLRTIPTSFLNYDGQIVRVKEGNYYYSTHYNRERFEVHLGEEIRDYDLENYLKKIDTDYTLTIRREEVDDTVIVYIRNAYPYDMEIELDLSKAINVSSSQELPYLTKVPANSEIYAILLRPEDNTKYWQYSIKCGYRRAKQ
ncbi:M23 family metallopeptidase [Orenia marismortui]|uniref:Peptidase M23-like protein n=1 Tax=Orenia marismortui TaxID=46469 RepID=A0A4R8H0T5_9FIRM|nr:M23 family metallopeptidase [Orenia marismortui]TDX52924.1 peptidase M23-like protein [Orenia marismortui]